MFGEVMVVPMSRSVGKIKFKFGRRFQQITDHEHSTTLIRASLATVDILTQVYHFYNVIIIISYILLLFGTSEHIHIFTFFTITTNVFTQMICTVLTHFKTLLFWQSVAVGVNTCLSRHIGVAYIKTLRFRPWACHQRCKLCSTGPQARRNLLPNFYTTFSRALTFCGTHRPKKH